MKLVYPEIAVKRVTPLFEKFADAINPVLINYRKFCKALECDITMKRL
jgi:hypothetical protein